MPTPVQGEGVMESVEERGSVGQAGEAVVPGVEAGFAFDLEAGGGGGEDGGDGVDECAFAGGERAAAVDGENGGGVLGRADRDGEFAGGVGAGWGCSDVDGQVWSGVAGVLFVDGDAVGVEVVGDCGGGGRPQGVGFEAGQCAAAEVGDNLLFSGADS